VDGAPSTPTVTPSIICPGATTNYTAVSANANNYAWTVGGATSWMPTAPDNSSIIVEWMPLPMTGQTFTVAASNGCGTSAGLTLNENCTSPRMVIGNMSLSVYPNPTRGLATVEIVSTEDSHVVLKVTDLAGRIVRSEQLHLSTGVSFMELDLTEVRKGTYLIYLEGQAGRTVERLVVE
jgi:hypothetical protein